MADDLFDRMLDLAALIARRRPTAAWPAAASRAFRRDVTCFDWRINSLLGDLGILHRNYPSKARIPGRVALVHDQKDAPTDDVLTDFLSRDGVLVVEGTEMLDVLGLPYTTTELEPGRTPVTGELVKLLGLGPDLWVDEDATTIALEGGFVYLACSDGPLLSSVPHAGGTVFVFATGAYSYDRKSTSKQTVTPRQLATELGIAIGDPTDVLASDQAFPRDLFLAEISMATALGHIVATGLDA